MTFQELVQYEIDELRANPLACQQNAAFVDALQKMALVPAQTLKQLVTKAACAAFAGEELLKRVTDLTCRQKG